MAMRSLKFRSAYIRSSVTLLCGGISMLLVARSIFSIFPVPSSNPIVAIVRTLTDVMVAPAQAVLGKPQYLAGAQADTPALATLALLLSLCVILACIRGFLAHTP